MAVSGRTARSRTASASTGRGTARPSRDRGPTAQSWRGVDGSGDALRCRSLPCPQHMEQCRPGRAAGLDTGCRSHQPRGPTRRRGLHEMVADCVHVLGLLDAGTYGPLLLVAVLALAVLSALAVGALAVRLGLTLGRYCETVRLVADPIRTGRYRRPGHRRAGGVSRSRPSTSHCGHPRCAGGARRRPARRRSRSRASPPVRSPPSPGGREPCRCHRAASHATLRRRGRCDRWIVELCANDVVTRHHRGATLLEVFVALSDTGATRTRTLAANGVAPQIGSGGRWSRRAVRVTPGCARP